MAISWIANAVHSSSPTAATTITLPTGSMAAGDLILIAALVADTVNNVLAAPTQGNYTDVVGATLYANDTNDVSLKGFYTYWNGSDTAASFGAVGGTNASNVAVCQIFRGVRQAADGGPFARTPTTATGIDTSNANPPSIATAAGEAIVIMGATGHTGGDTATYTNPANYTTNPSFRAHNDTIDGLVGMGYRLSGFSNPEDPGVFTAATIGTASENSWAAITMALAPAATARRSQVSWSELEIPTAPRRTQVSWGELEIPTAPRRSQVAWAELEVPTSPRLTRISWAELEIPDVPVATRRALISWAELEAPNAPRLARLAWAELEMPTAPRRGLVSWAELEVANAPRRTQVSWGELEVPTAPRRGLVSWATFECPSDPRRVLLSWAEFEVAASGPTIRPGIHTVLVDLIIENGETIYIYPDNHVRTDKQEFVPPGKPVWFLADQ